MLKCCLVGDGFGVEEQHIGIVAGEEQAAVMQAEACGNGPAHFADRIF
jgi:hypothetical protein